MIRKYYFINKFETNNIDKQDKQTIIIYRNYSLKTLDEKLILKIKNYCKKRGNKFYLSNNISLANKLNLDGAYIPSFNKTTKHLAFSYKQNFNIVGSAHNLKEIKIKEKQGISSIFISSIFKKNSNYLGLNRFKNLQNFTKSKVIALGGINNKNIRLLKLTKVSGFSGISFFKKKGPLKKGPSNILDSK